MKHFFYALVMIFFVVFMLSACENDDFDLSTIDIDAIDQIDVPAGTYQIPYTIESLSDLVKNYGANVSFIVFNKDDQPVEVTGDTFVIVTGDVYTVTIKLNIGDQFKEKTITVHAVGLVQMITVTVETNGGTGYETPQEIEINTVPDLTTIPTKLGYVFEGWYLDQACTLRYQGTELDEDTTLYVNWTPEQVSQTIVSFNLMGGNGNILDQMVDLGGYAIRPMDPTREGYIFSGWVVSESSSQPFDFETTPIHGQTVIYASWQLDTAIKYTVTYDLNGALQTGIISEEVSQGESPLGLTVIPVRIDYLFAGWSYGADDMTPLELTSVIINQDLTLYAIWHVDYVVIEASDYFTGVMTRDEAELDLGYVYPLKELLGMTNLGEIKQDFSISDSTVSYGVLYAHQNDVLEYYSLQATRIAGTIDLSGNPSYSEMPFDLLTEPLHSESVYFYRFYICFEKTIVYSDIYSFETHVTVPTGASVGVNYVLSGGYYQIDNGNDAYRPAFWFEVLDGYQATVDDVGYQSYAYLHREGTRLLVVTDETTGKSYLHVFHLDFQLPNVTLSINTVTTTDLYENVIPTFTLNFPHAEYLNYPITECGVLYSYEHPFLKLGLYDVSKTTGSYQSESSIIEPNTSIKSSGDDLYVRGYVVIQGKVSYTPYVYHLTLNQSNYVIEAQYWMNETESSVEYDYTIDLMYPFDKAINLYELSENALIETQSMQSITLDTIGQYFYTHGSSFSSINDLTIYDPTIPVAGVENGGQYQGSVLISADMVEPYWYMSFNGGEYIYLPSMIRLSEVGYYTIYFRTTEGIDSMSFEITE
jgi:uncharacterized repeat protein (TIGR02543 family)